MYDPLELTAEAARTVVRGEQRKYYRFRPARFYGGIATADCVGCCLRCIYCWAWKEVTQPGRFGRFYTPAQVASRLVSTARKKGFRQLRISGNEPTIARDHLIAVLERIPARLDFILETNGILIGHDRSYASDLARFPNLHVRVSLKGCEPEEFARLTGAGPEGFALQLGALEHLLATGVSAHAAAMVSFSSVEAVRRLERRLHSIHPDLSPFEPEQLAPYGSVEKRLRSRGIEPTLYLE
jgi:uncharacterized Fe-S cluster-containing radical SAM superfamily protein